VATEIAEMTQQPVRTVAPSRANDVDEDVALVLALRAGREDVTEILWRRHAAMVRGILRRLLGPDQDVEDLLQETFIHFFRQVKTLRDPRALRMFLITITTNVVRGELRMRRVRRWVRPTASGTLPDVPIREANVEARHALNRFYAILDDLSAYDRTAFVLRFIEDLDLTEVAEALGVSLATVKRHLAKIADRVYAKVGSDELLMDFLGKKGIPDAT
jgi:RNA polymerase sigma-70 factor (ECF subfamily)